MKSKIFDLKSPTGLTGTAGKKAVKRMMGMINWLGRYIPRLSDHLWPISRLTRNKVKFIWDDLCEAAFQRIKQLIAQSANKILRHPDITKPFYVVTDASSFGVGAVLMQKYEDKLEPVEFWSKAFDRNEMHWHVSEKELVAAVWAMEKWQKYLYGRKFIFIRL